MRASLPTPPPRASSPWSPPPPPARQPRWIFPSTHPGLASEDVERDVHEVVLPSPPPHPSMGLAELPADRDGCGGEDDRQPPVRKLCKQEPHLCNFKAFLFFSRFDQRMVVFAETKLQRDGIELSTGFRVIKDRRTNLLYSQHASLVYTPVPAKKVLHLADFGLIVFKWIVAMEEDEIHEKGFLEISKHLQMLQQGEEKARCLRLVHPV